jgi:hypothetical protein
MGGNTFGGSGGKGFLYMGGNTFGGSGGKGFLYIGGKTKGGSGGNLGRDLWKGGNLG